MKKSFPPSKSGSADQQTVREASTLVSRNLVINKHRTSVRLEPEMWAALKDISSREHATMHDVCSLISSHKPGGSSLTAAIRVFIVAYFRNATTDEGHSKAGHGHGLKLLSIDCFALSEAQSSGAVLYTLHTKKNSEVTPVMRVRSAGNSSV